MAHEPCYGYDKNRAAFQDLHIYGGAQKRITYSRRAVKLLTKSMADARYVIGRLPEEPLFFITRAKSFGSRISRKLQYICHESVCDSEGRDRWRIGFCYDDVMTCKRFSDNWPFVRGIDRLPLDHSHKGPVMRIFHICFANSMHKLSS